MRDWLVEHGFDELFLDLDPERGLKAGKRWQAELKRAAERCELVVFLVSPEWCASSWCRAEFLVAQNLNKRVFGLIVAPTPFSDIPIEMTSEWQLVDLTAGKRDYTTTVTAPPGDKKISIAFAKDGLERLRIGLMQAGIDPRYFAWPPEHDPDRSPYRGLQPLEAEDAGIFFGRDGPTVLGLDLLRGVGEGPPPRLLVILGASGAGKSSFLRAGLLPRLARENQRFLTLPVVRPESAVITGESGLIAGLERALKENGLAQSRAEIRKAVERGANDVAILMERLVAARKSGNGSKPNPPTLVLPIDQAEELFQAEEGDESRAFLDLLAKLLVRNSPALIALFTIRSDSYERLQTADSLQGLRQQALGLPPMPKGAYAEVIKGPARRLDGSKRALKIEEPLVDRLLADIEQGGAKDALPLLAFTLERLYREQGGDGDLRLSEYEELGGVKGSIEAAVERALRAADADPKIPRDRKARLVLLRRGLIPWLAGVDPETGSPRRRIARLSEIPAESRALIDLLVEQRLLSTDVSKEAGEVTIEPVHEALLRQWGLLQGWLAEDAGMLGVLDGIKRATRDWAANGKDKTWLAHGGGRLDDAEGLLARNDLAALLDPTDHMYLISCRAAETERRDRELEEARKLAQAEKKAADEQRRVASRTRLGLIVASGLALLSIGLALFGFMKAREANDRATEALNNESVGEAALSTKALSQGRPSDAVKLSLAAWPRAGDDRRPKLLLTVQSLAAALPNLSHLGIHQTSILKGHSGLVTAGAFSPDGTGAVTSSNDKTARVWDTKTGATIATLKGHENMVTSAIFSPDGTKAVTASFDGTARVWDAKTGAEILVLKGHEKPVTSALFSPDGTRVLTASDDDTARLWNATTGATLTTFKGDRASFSPDGARVLTITREFAHVWDAQTGVEIVNLAGHADGLYSAAFSADGTRIVTASSDGSARVWNAAAGAPIATLKGHDDHVLSAEFSPDGNLIVTDSDDGTIRIWDASTGAELRSLKGTSEVLSSDGALIAGVARNGVRVWSATTGAQVAAINSPDKSLSILAFSPDGTRLFLAGPDTIASIWGLQLPNVELKGHEDVIRSVAISPDGTQLATASCDKTARIWDVGTGKESIVLNGHEKGATSIAYSPDGTQIVTASMDGTARVWNAKTGQINAVLRGHENEVNSAAFSPDGSRIVTASFDDYARVWDAATGKEIQIGDWSWPAVYSAAFSPDGSRVVTVSRHAVEVWDAISGKQVRLLTEIGYLKKHGNTVNTAAFSPDGARVLTASSDMTARVWDAMTGATLAILRGHTSFVRSAVFSPDGTRVATASDDRTVRVWDAATGAELLRMNGVNSAAFSRNGARLVTLSPDRTANVWDLTTLEKGDGFEIACARLGSDTSLAEIRQRYGLREIMPICGDHRPLPLDALQFIPQDQEALEASSGLALMNGPTQSADDSVQDEDGDVTSCLDSISLPEFE